MFVKFHDELDTATYPATSAKYALSGCNQWSLSTDPQFYVVCLASFEDGLTTGNFGLVQGDVGAFQTWQVDNPSVEEVTDLAAEFSDGWRDIWQAMFALPYTDADLAEDNPYAIYLHAIEQHRARLHTKVDQRTRELIAMGFEYPESSGQFFSLSIEAQSTWSNGYNARSFLSYPVMVTTMDEQIDVTLADAAEITAFYTAMVTTARGYIDSGRALKNAVRDADADQDAINTAAEDNR